MEHGRLPQPPSRAEQSSAVAYHDPCYLGRYNGEYDAPRSVLAGAGALVSEMERSRERSFCCGGGGGRAFAVEPPDQRVNVLLAAQARATGAPVLATACPFCLLMLEDGCKTAARNDGGASAPQQVRDIAEILDDALRGSGAPAS
jgi:Fe-S oxidoreductase